MSIHRIFVRSISVSGINTWIMIQMRKCCKRHKHLLINKLMSNHWCFSYIFATARQNIIRDKVIKLIRLYSYLRWNLNCFPVAIISIQKFLYKQVYIILYITVPINWSTIFLEHFEIPLYLFDTNHRWNGIM